MSDGQAFFAVIFLVGLAIMALVIRERLWRDWQEELAWDRFMSERAHQYRERQRQLHLNMRRAGIKAEHPNTN